MGFHVTNQIFSHERSRYYFSHLSHCDCYASKPHSSVLRANTGLRKLTTGFRLAVKAHKTFFSATNVFSEQKIRLEMA